jgi:hypothetical protein
MPARVAIHRVQENKIMSLGMEFGSVDVDAAVAAFHEPYGVVFMKMVWKLLDDTLETIGFNFQVIVVDDLSDLFLHEKTPLFPKA